MNRMFPVLALAIITALHGPRRAWADERNDEAEKHKAPVPVTVAVLDFEAGTPGNPDMGKQVSEMLAIILSGEEGFTLVDRASMSHTLAEHELNLTGLVNLAQATKIGKLVGAKILITGRIFLVDKQLYITAKFVGTETSVMDGAIVAGDKDADVSKMMSQLAVKVTDRLTIAGPKLIARAEPMDPLPDLKKALAGVKLPKVAVRIQERHIAPAPAPRIDPAAENEVKKVLKDAGFTIIEGNEKDFADGGVTAIVDGEAFSEFAARIGNLVSCSARVEIKIVDRKTGEVLFVDNETTRGVDLAENVASKSALQKAGHIIAIRILRHFEKTLVKVDPP